MGRQFRQDTKEVEAMIELLGEILWALQEQLTPEEQQELWACFEGLLMQYLDEEIKQGDCLKESLEAGIEYNHGLEARVTKNVDQQGGNH